VRSDTSLGFRRLSVGTRGAPAPVGRGLTWVVRAIMVGAAPGRQLSYTSVGMAGEKPNSVVGGWWRLRGSLPRLGFRLTRVRLVGAL
jgi:hypothetical protein